VKLTTHLHLGPRSKNEWSYTFNPQYAFMVWCLVKRRDNFTFTLICFFMNSLLTCYYRYQVSSIIKYFNFATFIEGFPSTNHDTKIFPVRLNYSECFR